MYHNLPTYSVLGHLGYSQFGLLFLIEFFCGPLFPLEVKLLGHRVYTVFHSHLSIRGL